MKRQLAAIIGGCLLVVLLAACGGNVGPEGPVGPAGPPGPQGPAGPPGESATARREYVGSDRCGECHESEYAKFVLSGHPYKLTKVEGAAPEYPYDSITGGVDSPPDGFTWDDISYVIGGFRWKARFVDQRGYLITGDENATTQFNFANDTVGTQETWVGYHAGETDKPYDCGACHTTGYQPEGHQNDLEGIIGTWAFEGIQCEECHGPGGLHASDPQGYAMDIDRGSQLCGQCHVRGNPATLEAQDGFEQNYQQYDDLYNSKHFALSCVTCHDPHASSVYSDPDVNPDHGIRQSCETCHWQNTERKVSQHSPGFVTCVACHMPPMAKSAAGILENYTADVRSHQFSINVNPEAPQFSEDGLSTLPYLTVPYVCGQCHNDAAFGALDLAVLYQFATDYHNPAAEAEQ